MYVKHCKGTRRHSIYHYFRIALIDGLAVWWEDVACSIVCLKFCCMGWKPRWSMQVCIMIKHSTCPYISTFTFLLSQNSLNEFKCRPYNWWTEMGTYWGFLWIHHAAHIAILAHRGHTLVRLASVMQLAQQIRRHHEILRGPLNSWVTLLVTTWAVFKTSVGWWLVRGLWWVLVDHTILPNCTGL